MNQDNTRNSRAWAIRLAAFACSAALLLAVSGCAVQPVGTTTNENAAANRQYMAQLNQKTGELEAIMVEFQSAVSDTDAVGMKAAADRAGKTIDSIKKIDPPTSEDGNTADLVSVKELYVAGLEEINESMNDYANLYNDVAAGKVNQASFSGKLKAVQASYDAAVEKISAADEELTKLANE